MFPRGVLVSVCFLLSIPFHLPTAAFAADAEPSDQVVRSTSPVYSKERPAVLMSADGKYRISLYSAQSPIPLQKIHSWYARVETPDGKPVEQARIYVHGGMPAHRHGFPTKPRVNNYLGNGDYEIEGVKFSMSGHWEMRLNIKEQTQRDRVVFEIDL